MEWLANAMWVSMLWRAANVPLVINQPAGEEFRISLFTATVTGNKYIFRR